MKKPNTVIDALTDKIAALEKRNDNLVEIMLKRLGINVMTITGSELCTLMLDRGDQFVVCCMDLRGTVRAVTSYHTEADGELIFHCMGEDDADPSYWCRSAEPINRHGEPLTAKEVGL